MNKLSTSIFMGASKYIMPVPVSIWWINDLPNNAGYNSDHCFDINNNYYSLLRAYPGASTSSTITKINDNATSLNTYTVSSSDSSSGYDILATDSSGNIFVAGSSLYSPTYIHITKYNSSFVKQWERKVTTTASNGLAIRNLAVDSTGSAYLISVDSDVNGTGKLNISKFSSTGTATFHRMYAISIGNADSTALYSRQVFDSADNLHLVIYDGINGGNYVIKYSSTGTLTWQRKITSTYGALINDISVTPAGDVYVALENFNIIGGSDATLLKINSSGTLQWTRWFTSSGGVYTSMVPGTPVSTSVDSTGNIYLTYSAIYSGSYGLLFKFDSAGTKLLSQSLNITPLGKAVLSPNGNMALTNIYNNGYSLKVPIDGSKAGVQYGNVAYQNTTYGFYSTNTCTVATTTDGVSTTPSLTVSTTAITTISGPTTPTLTLGYVR